MNFKKATLCIAVLLLSFILIQLFLLSPKNAAPITTLAITNIQITEVSFAGYRVTCTVNSDDINEVFMPSWTKRDGDDDLIWHKAAVSGNTASFYIPVSAHKNESGQYITHIYLYGSNNNYAFAGIKVTVPTPHTPVLSNVTVSELSEKGYRVTCTLDAGSDVKEVLMPTWTESSTQDDLIWYKAVIDGNVATCYISTSEHNNETGIYQTHIYAYNTSGHLLSAEPMLAWVDLPSPKPEIVNLGIIDLTPTGFKVTGTISAGAGVNRVEVQVFTKANGKDDLQTYTASVVNNEIAITVPTSNHGNQTGEYCIKTILYDQKGQTAISEIETNVSVSLDTNTAMNLQFIDVNHGDCMLVSSQGKYLLIDTGRGGIPDTVISHLNVLGVEDLEVFISHPHYDHLGNLPAIIENFNVTKVYLKDEICVDEWEETQRQHVLAQLSARGCIPVEPSVGYSFHVGDALCEIIGPVSIVDDGSEKQTNNNSYWLRITCGKTRLLTIGDAGKTAQSAMLAAEIDIKADILKIPHHGLDALAKHLIHTIDPQYAVISTGSICLGFNPSVVADITKEGVEVLNTMDYGTISINIVNDKVSIVY